MKLGQRIKKAFQNYLADLAKTNKETFGNQTMDCCNLNRRPENQKKTEAGRRHIPPASIFLYSISFPLPLQINSEE